MTKFLLVGDCVNIESDNIINKCRVGETYFGMRNQFLQSIRHQWEYDTVLITDHDQTHYIHYVKGFYSMDWITYETKYLDEPIDIPWKDHDSSFDHQYNIRMYSIDKAKKDYDNLIHTIKHKKKSCIVLRFRNWSKHVMPDSIDCTDKPRPTTATELVNLIT